MFAILLALLLPSAAMAYVTPVLHCPAGQPYVEMLAAPAAEAQVIGRFFSGTFAGTDGADGAYAAVGIGGSLGFMKTEYLETAPTENPVSANLPVIPINNPYGTGLHLRVSPDIGTEESPEYSAGLFANGTQVTVLGIVQDWAYVQVGGLTGYMRLFGLPALANYALPGGSSLYYKQLYKLDTHGYAITAMLTSDAENQFSATVGVCFNSVMLNSILIGYNIYADDAVIGYLETTGWMGGNAAAGAPVSFSGSFAVPEGTTRIRLQPVWSRSGYRKDGEGDSKPENSFVFGLKP